MAYYTTEHADNSIRIAAGATAGIIGGILMAVFLMLYHQFVTEMGLWEPVNRIGSLAGLPAAIGFGTATVVGLVIHIATSAIFGMILGLTLVRTPGALMAIISGLIFGMIIFGIMYYILLPVLEPAFAQAGQSIPMMIAHLLFGLGFVFYPPLVERYSHR